MLTLPILIAATAFHPHRIRSAEDALETTYAQIYEGDSNAPSRKTWDAANSYIAKKVGNVWVLTRKDKSLVVHLDAQTGKIIGYED